MKGLWFSIWVIAFAMLNCVHASSAPAQDAGESIYRDLVFSRPGGRDLLLDLYVPHTASPPPVVIWWHGGAWQYGDRRWRFFVRGLTRYGIAVATAQYRLSLSAQWPAQKDDAFAALRWMQKHGRDYGVDPSRLAVSGDSSGGHLASLVAVTEGRRQIKAVFAMYPVTNVTELALRYQKYKHLNLITQLFGGPYEKTIRQMTAASPVNFVSRDTPPFLIFHGDRDIVVPIEESREMDAALRRHGVESHLVVMPGLIHGFHLDEKHFKIAADFLKAHL